MITNLLIRTVNISLIATTIRKFSRMMIQRLLSNKDNKNSDLSSQTNVKVIVVSSIILTSVLLTLYSSLTRNFTRYSEASDIPKYFFQNRKSSSKIGKNGHWLYGKVLSVGDGDNLNFYHMPGGFIAGWGTLRHEPQLDLTKDLNKQSNFKKLQSSTKKQTKYTTNSNPLTTAWNIISSTRKSLLKSSKTNKKSSKKNNNKNKLKQNQVSLVGSLNEAYQNWFGDKTSSAHFMSLPIYYKNNYKHKTISVRLCGIDAPERSHFGSKAQPFSDEAMNFLKHTLLNKKVYIKPLEIDRYGRCVARVLYYDGFLFFKKERDISLEMLKVGLATVYESKSDIDFDGQETLYRNAEYDSKRKKRGMYKLKRLETPAEFKRKLKQ